MARKVNTTPKVPRKRPVEQYQHEKEERLNNPPVGLVTPETDRETSSKTYAYDPHLDPALQWAGKAEHLSFSVPTQSLHVHERIDPRAIIEAVRKKNGSNYEQLSLFADQEENPPLREAVEFYQHAHNWSNRLIAGDSLVVMNSLLEKEGMAGKVQMVYLDPPYGIKYGSNFQPFINKRNVKDGRDEDLTAEPETVKVQTELDIGPNWAKQLIRPTAGRLFWFSRWIFLGMGALLPQLRSGRGIQRCKGGWIPVSTCGRSPSRLSLAGCVPAEPASVWPAGGIVLRWSVIVKSLSSAAQAGIFFRSRLALRAARAAASLASRAARIASARPASLSAGVR